MKKVIRAIPFFIIVILVFFLIKENTQDDFLVFEMSREDSTEATWSIPPAGRKKCDTYFALKNDNVMVWAYGIGNMGRMTYASFFERTDEEGIVRLSKEDAFYIKKQMKKMLDNYVPVSNDYTGGTGSGNSVIIYKGKRYMNDSLKEGKSPTDEDLYSFYALEADIEMILDKYREKYKDEIDGYTYIGKDKDHPYTFYCYLDLQDGVMPLPKKRQSE